MQRKNCYCTKKLRLLKAAQRGKTKRLEHPLKISFKEAI